MKESANLTRAKIMFLLEEQSAEEMLKQFMPRHFPGVSCTYRRFSGKGELLKRLAKVVRNHDDSECHFLILCDRDQDDCRKLKKHIDTLCHQTGKHHKCKIRIACYELESWYLAQLDVVASHFGVPELVRQQNRYANSDNVDKPSKILERITRKNYQKIKGSRIMGRYLEKDVPRSTSFRHFINAITSILK